MRISSVACGISNATAANPDTKTQDGLCCGVLLCLQGARPRGAARHAARWLLGALEHALEEAGRTCANAVRGARERRKTNFGPV